MRWFWIIAAAALLCLPASAAPAYVQSATCTASSATSIVCTWSGATVSGNAIGVVLGASTNVAATTCSDSQLNSYTLYQAGSTVRNVFAIAKNITGGGGTVTCNFGSAVTSAMIISEYSGVDQNAPLDVRAAANGSATTAITCGTTTNTANDVELIIGSITTSSNPTITAGATYTERNQVANGSAVTADIEDKNTAAVGTQNATATAGASINFSCQTVALKQSIGATSGQGPTTTTAAADNAGIGTTAWSGPSNAIAEDGTFSTNTGGGTSHYLFTTGFGFNVSGTIAGFLVEVKAKDDDVTNTGVPCNDQTTLNGKMLKAGAVVGNGKTSDLTTSNTWRTVGGNTNDQWGAAWVAADINNVNFGAAVWATFSPDCSANNTASIDSVRITVYTVASASSIIRKPIIVSQTREAKVLEVVQ